VGVHALQPGHHAAGDAVSAGTRPTPPDLRYPVGPYEPEEPTPGRREAWLETIEALPGRLRAVVTDLDDAQLDTPYRPGGWTVRQLVHHIADSHANSYIRFMLALNEEGRTVSLYDQDRWASNPFVRTGPIELSLALLDGIHARWAATLRLADDAAFGRTIEHPEWGTMSVGDLLCLYDWHSRHHLAHITALREREGW
jgi:uncharacterized damage-inducible protein DinB